MNLRSQSSVCMQLRYKSLISLTPEHSGELTLICKKGKLWVTISGLAQDIVIGPGESTNIPSGHRAVIEALDDATFALSDPASRKAA